MVCALKTSLRDPEATRSHFNLRRIFHNSFHRPCYAWTIIHSSMNYFKVEATLAAPFSATAKNSIFPWGDARLFIV